MTGLFSFPPGEMTMLTARATQEFRREFFHALRNDFTSEQAADTAMHKTKESVLALLALDKSLSEIDKLEVWADCLDHLIYYQMFLRGIPVDKSRLPPKGTDPVPPASRGPTSPVK